MARGGKRAGAGRKHGSRGKVTVALGATLTEMAQRYTAQALQALVDAATSEKATWGARVTAAGMLLDRGHGRAVQAVEHSGAGGEPIKLIITGVPRAGDK